LKKLSNKGVELKEGKVHVIKTIPTMPDLLVVKPITEIVSD
jgi:hypothetical protein